MTGPDPAGRRDPSTPGATTFFDSHLHLTDRRFDEDRSEVLRRARQAGVTGMVTVASTPEDARAGAELASEESGVWSSVGLHPHEAASWRAGESRRRILELLDAGRPVVAVGETGFDFHYENSPREAQARAFRTQLEIAAERDVPVIVHSREADRETAALMREFSGRVRGVLHCFTGGDALLEAALDAGWYVSFSGIATFEGFDGLDRVRRVPERRLLVETDSPYLSPEPVRGLRNEPAHVVHTCRFLARERATSEEELAALTGENARRFYGLDSG